MRLEDRVERVYVLECCEVPGRRQPVQGRIRDVVGEGLRTFCRYAGVLRRSDDQGGDFDISQSIERIEFAHRRRHCVKASRGEAAYDIAHVAIAGIVPGDCFVSEPSPHETFVHGIDALVHHDGGALAPGASLIRAINRGGVDQGKRRETVRVLQGKCLADHSAHGHTGEMHTLNGQAVEQPDDIAGKHVERVGSGWVVRCTMTTRVVAEHAKALTRRQVGIPKLMVGTETVAEQDHGRVAWPAQFVGDTDIANPDDLACQHGVYSP